MPRPRKTATEAPVKPAKPKGRPKGSKNQPKGALKSPTVASSSLDDSEAGANDRMAQDPSKRAAFEALQAAVNAKFGAGSMMDLDDPTSHQVDRISSGNAGIDRVLGGGWPRGRIIEIYGVESGGKTTLALHAIASIQNATGGNSVFVDVEHALSPGYAQALGVDLSRTSISQPNSGEEALEIVDMAIRSGSVEVVVLDSVASLVTKAELEGSMEDQQVGVQARLMGKAMRKINAAVNKSKCIVIFINQLREKVGVMGPGEKTVTPGGRSLKFHASIRLDVRYIGKLKRGETIIGQQATVQGKKNKVSPPFKKATLDLYYSNAKPPGFCPATALLDEAVDAGVCSKSGSTYRFGKETIAVGRLKAREVLLKEPELFDEIVVALAEELA